MKTERPANVSKSSLLNWFSGLKDVWQQAKNDYREHKQRSAKGLNQRFDDLCNDTIPVSRSRSTKEKRRKRLRKDKTCDTTQERTTGGSDTVAPSQLSLYVSQEDPALTIDRDKTMSSILDASFLRKIRDPPLFDPEPLGAAMDIALPLDNLAADGKQATKQEDILQADRKRKFDESTGTVETARIDEEYIARVHLRVQQLEAELEAARARLQEYESTKRQITTGLDVCAPPERSTTQGQMEISDHGALREGHFVLSPSQLEFSPIRVQPADVSNGEIARREALQALKQRIKRHGE